MRVLGAIIAGGKSSRMGQEKALIVWREKPLIEHVAERLAPQLDELVINANGDPSRFKPPVIPDIVETGTPLAGLHAALTYAAQKGFDAVLSVPSDTPLLPHDLRARLEQVFTLPPSGEGAPEGRMRALPRGEESKRKDRSRLQDPHPALRATFPRRRKGERAAIAVSRDQPHFLTGLWSVECLPLLTGLRRVMDFAEATNARRVTWPVEGFDPFFNINTPEDLSDLP